MAEPIRPAATPTFGKDNWFLVLDYENIAALTVTELGAASSLDITRIAFRETGKPTQTTNRPTATPRLGDTRNYEFVGTSNVTGGDMLYAFADQATAGSDGKKLYELIPEGTTAALVNRRGIGRAVAPTSGQFYNAYPVQFGPSFPADAGTDEASESAMTAAFAVVDEVAINKALVA